MSESRKLTDEERQANEDEANEFAMALLMPRKFLERECQGLSIFDEDRIKAIAKKFGVSVPMLVFRLGWLRQRGQIRLEKPTAAPTSSRGR
jgi:Zn-dependent peptidase ImmA (M78 family)